MLIALLNLFLILALIGILTWAAMKIVGVLPMEGTIKAVLITIIEVVALVIVAFMVINFFVSFLHLPMAGFWSGR